MIKANVNEREYDLSFDKYFDKGKINGKEFTYDAVESGTAILHIISNLQSYTITILNKNIQEKTVELDIDGEVFNVKLSDELDLMLKKLGLSKVSKIVETSVKSPMPGLVQKIFVKEGDEVKQEDDLFVLEAMKMENIIKSPHDGIIKEIFVEAGNSVEKNKEMLVFE